MDLKEKFKEQFTAQWWMLLQNEFEKPYMFDIYNKLKEASQNKIDVFPSSKEVFNSFKYSYYDEVLVCFILPAPIVEFGMSKQWRVLSRIIENEAFEGLNLNLENNLDYMLPQGVFNLPVVLTKGDKIEHNTLGWQNFTREVIKHLNNSLNKIIFVYEDSCMEFLRGIDSKHTITKLEEGCIKKVDNFLKQEYNIKLNWQ